MMNIAVSYPPKTFKNEVAESAVKLNYSPVEEIKKVLVNGELIT